MSESFNQGSTTAQTRREDAMTSGGGYSTHPGGTKSADSGMHENVGEGVDYNGAPAQKQQGRVAGDSLEMGRSSHTVISHDSDAADSGARRGGGTAYNDFGVTQMGGGGGPPVDALKTGSRPPEDSSGGGHVGPRMAPAEQRHWVRDVGAGAGAGGGADIDGGAGPGEVNTFDHERYHQNQNQGVGGGGDAGSGIREGQGPDPYTGTGTRVGPGAAACASNAQGHAPTRTNAYSAGQIAHDKDTDTVEPSTGDKIKGGVQQLAGALTQNPEMIARGQQRKAGVRGDELRRVFVGMRGWDDDEAFSLRRDVNVITSPGSPSGFKPKFTAPTTGRENIDVGRSIFQAVVCAHFADEACRHERDKDDVQG
ncbi:hypothetical protein R3P38DRAFT_2812642 [Favolaschia claudopus]|uniref:Uncharacterized protein n=1 Tax=Favolaschia claudopus TaxID=2862362 RepID=A0AAV9Z6B7_9AGAR